MDEEIVKNYAPSWTRENNHRWSEQIQNLRDIIHPPRSAHYQAMTIEPIEVMEAWLTKEQMMGFLLGNTIKYIGRYNSVAEGKGGLRDLKKAQDYLTWAIARLPDESTES
jgi:hypothetical protein